MRLGGEGVRRLLPVPGDDGFLELLSGGPVPGFQGNADAVGGVHGPLPFAAREGALGIRVGEGGGEFGDQPLPLYCPPGVFVEYPQALHSADDLIPPAVLAG